MFDEVSRRCDVARQWRRALNVKTPAPLEDRTGVELSAMYKFRGELVAALASDEEAARSTSKNAYLRWLIH